MTGTSYEDRHTFLNISRSILLRMRNVCCRQSGTENQNTHCIFNNVFVFENCAVYKIMWKTFSRKATDDNTAHVH